MHLTQQNKLSSKVMVVKIWQ